MSRVKKITVLSVLLGTGLSCNLAMANTLNNSLSTNFDPDAMKNKKESILNGDFGFQTNELVQDVGDVPGNKNFGYFNIDYKSYQSNGVYKSLQMTSRVNDQQVLEYSLKEAVLEFRYSTSRFALGRTNLEWSHADMDWGLGKINNRVNFDYFEPGQEGLIGFFYDKKFSNGFEIGLFGSFIYIPELSQGMIVD